MKCSKCGRENTENARFCRYCGNPVFQDKGSLLERAKRQDQDALAEIYSQSSAAVYRVIKVLVKEEDTVYDLLQDTYVKAFTRLDQLQDADKLVPWLKMIANNTAKDWLKKSKPVYFTDISSKSDTEDISFEETIEDERLDQNPEMAMDQKEVSRLVMEILDQLPEDQRMVIGMFYYEEMSVRDIAATLGISENTVKSRLNYGRKKIKELVLDLEKKGTKLYSVAPLAFFVYLLRTMDKTPTEVPDVSAMHRILAASQKNMENGTGAQQMSSGNADAAGNAGTGYGQTGGASGNSGRVPAGNHIGNTTEKAAGGTAGKAVGNTAGRVTGGTAGKAAGSTAGKAAGSAAGKLAGQAAGAAAKHIGIKIAAIVLAGTIGAGGITYGVVKNADKLPFIQKQEQETAGVEPEEKAERQSGEPSEAESIAKEPEVTGEPEATAEPDVTETTGTTEVPETTAEPEITEIPEITKAAGEPEITGEPELTEIPQETGAPEVTEPPRESGTVAAEAQPDNVIKPLAEGDYGDNIHWFLDEEYTLIVAGKGAIADVKRENQESAPWEEYADQIQKIVIGEGITYIGESTFSGCQKVTDISMADDVTEIASYAFGGMPNSTDGLPITVKLSQSLEKIDDEAFTYSNIVSLTLPDSVKEIGAMAFRRCGLLSSVTIGENSKLEHIGKQAFAECPIDEGGIHIPAGIQSIKSEAFEDGAFESQAVFSQQLRELGLKAFGTGCGGLNTVYFKGDAPEITDDRIATPEGDTVFQENTTVIYYPEGNPTWDGYDLSRLSQTAEFRTYDPAQLEQLMAEAKAGTQLASSAESSDTVKEMYRALYNNIIKNQNLQVVADGTKQIYDDTGYANNLVLGAYLDDLDGDGEAEMLMLHTGTAQTYENDSGERGEAQLLVVEYCKLAGQKAQIKTTEWTAYLDFKELLSYDRIQVGFSNQSDGKYLCIYDRRRTPSPKYEKQFTCNTQIFKITDTGLVSQSNLSTSVYGTSGYYIQNTMDVYNGTYEEVYNYTQSQIQPYGMDIDLGFSGPHILEFTRNKVGSQKEDTFSIQNCFAQQDGQENSGEIMYYVTRLYSEPEGQQGEYWYPATQNVEYDEDSITFYGSFSVSNAYPLIYTQENYRPYEARTFKLTSQTQYYSHDGYNEVDYPTSKSSFLECCKLLNGLNLVM